MEQKEVELLVEKKLAEAKLEVAEKRNQFLLWFFGIMLSIAGVAVPLINAINSSSKVDKEIEWMRTQVKETQIQSERKIKEQEEKIFSNYKEMVSKQDLRLSEISDEAKETISETKEQVQELIGKQLAKPELTILYKGNEVDGRTIDITGKESWGSEKFEILNKGKAPAKNVKIVLYQTKDSKLTNINWIKREASEEKDFDVSNLYNKNIELIFPNDKKLIETNFMFVEGTKSVKENYIIRIFYDEILVPIKIHFSIEIKSK